MPGVAERAINLTGFSGGLNTQAPPTELRDNELVECTNFFIDNEGQLRKRPGFFKSVDIGSPTSTKVILGYDHNTNRYIVSEPGTGGLWNASGGASASFNAVIGTPVDKATWAMWINGSMYVGFQISSQVHTVTGSPSVPALSAAIANSPSSNVAVWHKGRIFTDVYSVPGRIAFSSPITPTATVATWTATDIIDVGIDNKDPITALISLGDLLLIFKINSTWVMYVQGTSPADWVVRRIHETIGCQKSRGSIPAITIGSECYFISPKGIFKTNGNSFINISKNIWDPEDEAYSWVSAGGSSRITKWGNFLLVVLKTGFSIAEFNFVYNLENGAWSNWTFLGGTFDDLFMEYRIESDAAIIATKGGTLYYSTDRILSYYDTILAGGVNSYSDGLLYSSSGTGSAYTSSFQTKEFTTGIDDFLRMKWLGLEYIARASPTFKTVQNGVQGSAQTPGFHATLRKGYKISGGGRCRTFALRGEHALTSPYEFYRASMYLTSKVPILASGTP